MRLLIVIHYPFFGGPQNQVLRLTGPLETRGVTTTVVLPDEPGNAFDRLAGAGIDVRRLPLRRLRALPDPRVQLRFAANTVADVKRLRAVADEVEADVVQINGLVNPHGAVAARLRGAAVVWQLLDTRAPMALRWALMPAVLRLSDAVMTTGMGVADVHPGARRLGRRLVPFFPPVDTAGFAPSPERRRLARRRLGIDEDAPLVGTLGNLTPQKGHEFLLEAAARVRRSVPGLRVALLGTPMATQEHYADDLRRRARELSFREGEDLIIASPGDAVAEHLAALDVFALTSVPRSEGIPTTILEAMSSGIPVVATDVGAVREAVLDGVTGHVVAPLAVDAIADRVEALLREPETAAAFGSAGRRRAVELFDVERCADVHRHAYELALQRARQR